MVQKQMVTDPKVHLTFIDFEKGYDTVPRCKLWEALERMKVNEDTYI